MWVGTVPERIMAVDRLMELLSQQERQRVQSYSNHKSVRQFVFGRGLLRELLGKYTGQAPAGLNIVPGCNGKP